MMAATPKAPRTAAAEASSSKDKRSKNRSKVSVPKCALCTGLAPGTCSSSWLCRSHDAQLQHIGTTNDIEQLHGVSLCAIHRNDAVTDADDLVWMLCIPGLNRALVDALNYQRDSCACIVRDA